MKNLLIIIILTLTTFITKGQINCGTRIIQLPIETDNNVGYAVGVLGKFWNPGQEVTVVFLDRDPIKEEKVKLYANEWTKYANLRFRFTQDRSADIRIKFAAGRGHWSLLGTDCKFASIDPYNSAKVIPNRSDASMNLGWVGYVDESEYRRVILHEFGHALGLFHEHSHPANRIPWDKPKVYTYYDTTQGWNKQMVDQQVLMRLSTSESQYGKYDPESIMHYPIPNFLTIGDFEVGWNTRLSNLDKWFVEEIYGNSSGKQWYYFAGGTHIRSKLGTSGVSAANIRIGDFNNDGTDDIFTSTGSEWKISYGGISGWKVVNTVDPNVKLSNLLVGDFDNDGYDDIFYTDGKQWYYSSKAKGPWQKLGSSGVSASNIRIGDFNNDGTDDIFTSTGSEWKISYGGISGWKVVNTVDPNVKLSNLLVGDFDNDGYDDIFYTDGKQWNYSSKAKGSWQKLGSSGVSAANIRIGDFNGDGTDDIFTSSSYEWKISYGGKSGWKVSNTSPAALANLLVGNFDGDSSSDIFQVPQF